MIAQLTLKLQAPPLEKLGIHEMVVDTAMERKLQEGLRKKVEEAHEEV